MPHDQPAIRRAAIQLTFNPEDMKWEDQERAYLETNSTKLPDGHWELMDNARSRILLALKANDQLLDNYTRFGVLHERYSKEQRVLGAVLKGRKLRLGEMTTAELKILFRIKFWVDGGGYDLPSHEVIRNILGRHEITDKFLRQTSSFSGRKEELAVLKDYVFSPSPAGQDLQDYPPLLVYGIGGIGKSTLISKFLLDEAIRPNRYRMPFVYLDFDHPGLTISNPLSLFAAGLRQLAAQFPVMEGEEAHLENALGDLLAAQALRAASFSPEGEDQLKTKGKTLTFTSASWQRTLDDLSRRHLEGVELTSQPILIVLDSFEEAQYRTGETVIRNFLEFLDELTGRLPNIRLLIVGRSDLVVSPFNFQKLPVGDFDEDAAKAYLKALGIEQPEVRYLIQEKVGGNPLTLKLAAALAEQEGVGTDISLTDFASQLAGTQVQELLVRRNIEHIRDPEVQELALPGMLLRRIDAKVIEKVLAPVCGLGDITPQKAQDLFEGLQRVTFLIEMVGGELHFRRDLRIALRDEIWRKQRDQCLRLHHFAAEYYHPADNPGNDPKLLAEHYYHVFQFEGKPSDGADSVSWGPLRPFLEDALMELPPQAAAYLARQFKVRLPAAIMEQAGQEENDYSMVRRMEEVTLLGYGGLQQMYEVWEQVNDRTESNEYSFIFYRQLLAVRLGYFTRVLDDLAPRSRAKIQGEETYLELLKANYTGDYSAGLAAATEYNFLSLRPQLALEAGVFMLKLQGLLQLPFDEDMLVWFSRLVDDFPADQPANTKIEQGIWRPFTARLWDVHKTAIPLQKAQFEGLCRSIHSYYTSDVAAYAIMVEALVSVDPARFSLVLQNETKRLVEDIATPGVDGVVAHDYADFIMEYFGGDWESINKFLSRLEGKQTNSGKVPQAPNTSSGRAGESRDLEEKSNPSVEQIKGLIAEDRLPEALGKIQELATEFGDEFALNQAYLLSSRYQSLEDNQTKGYVTNSDSSVQRGQIINSILKLTESLDR